MVQLIEGWKDSWQITKVLSGHKKFENLYVCIISSSDMINANKDDKGKYFQLFSVLLSTDFKLFYFHDNVHL